jgi:hypothetical protein
MICNLTLIQGATFDGHTDFRGAVFGGDAYLTYSKFHRDVWFHDRYLPGHVQIPPGRFATAAFYDDQVGVVAGPGSLVTRSRICPRSISGRGGC